jgi:hypothetical protein
MDNLAGLKLILTLFLFPNFPCVYPPSILSAGNLKSQRRGWLLRWCVSDSAAGLTGGGETLSGTGLTSVDVELKLLTMMVRSLRATY